MVYASIMRMWRGINFHKDFKSIDEFRVEMEAIAEDSSSICWAHLFDESGKMVATYKRGYEEIEII